MTTSPTSAQITLPRPPSIIPDSEGQDWDEGQTEPDSYLITALPREEQLHREVAPNEHPQPRRGGSAAKSSHSTEACHAQTGHAPITAALTTGQQHGADTWGTSPDDRKGDQQ